MENPLAPSAAPKAKADDGADGQRWVTAGQITVQGGSAAIGANPARPGGKKDPLAADGRLATKGAGAERGGAQIRRNGQRPARPLGAQHAARTRRSGVISRRTIGGGGRSDADRMGETHRRPGPDLGRPTRQQRRDHQRIGQQNAQGAAAQPVRDDPPDAPHRYPTCSLGDLIHSGIF